MTTTLTATRGDDETYELTLKQADGSALDLTGASLWFSIKRYFGQPDADAVAQKTIGAGITVVDAAAGRADVMIAADDTASLPAARLELVWDCQVKDATGAISTPDGGLFVVEPDVTHATG